VNFAKEIKTINIKKTTFKDTLINGKNAVICTYIYQDTIIDEKRNFSIFRFIFDKSTKLPLYFTHLYYLPVTGKDGVNIHYLPVVYKDSSDVPKLIKISYIDCDLSKKDFKKSFTSKAFNKTFKIIENAPPLKRKIELRVGVPVPEWELNSLDGKKFQMSYSNNKIRFLVFTKINCSPCMQSIAYLNELFKNYPDIDVLAIYAKDDAKSLKKYKKSHKIEYPILPATSDLTNLYHVNLYPTFYLVDKNGIIQFVQSGYGEGSKEKFKKAIEKLLK
jgi:peroxiredoxin